MNQIEKDKGCFPYKGQHLTGPHFEQLTGYKLILNNYEDAELSTNGKNALKLHVQKLQEGFGQCNCKVMYGKKCQPTTHRTQEKENDNKCQNFCLGYECDGACGKSQGAICLNQAIANREWKKMILVPRAKAGAGVAAAELIKDGQLICEYIGVIYLHYENPFHKDTHYAYTLLENNDIKKTVVLEPTRMGHIGRQINHSEDSNCKAIPMLVGDKLRLGIYATKQISIGTDINLDYGPMLEKLGFTKCHCGAIEHCIHAIQFWKDKSDENKKNPPNKSDESLELQSSPIPCSASTSSVPQISENISPLASCTENVPSNQPQGFIVHVPQNLISETMTITVDVSEPTSSVQETVQESPCPNFEINQENMDGAAGAEAVVSSPVQSSPIPRRERTATPIQAPKPLKEQNKVSRRFQRTIDDENTASGSSGSNGPRRLFKLTPVSSNVPATHTVKKKRLPIKKNPKRDNQGISDDDVVQANTSKKSKTHKTTLECTPVREIGCQSPGGSITPVPGIGCQTPRSFIPTQFSSVSTVVTPVRVSGFQSPRGNITSPMQCSDTVSPLATSSSTSCSSVAPPDFESGTFTDDDDMDDGMPCDGDNIATTTITQSDNEEQPSNEECIPLSLSIRGNVPCQSPRGGAVITNRDDGNPCQSPGCGAVITNRDDGNPCQSSSGGVVTTPIRVNGIGFQSPHGGAVTTPVGVNGNPGQSPHGGAVTTPVGVNGMGFQSPRGGAVITNRDDGNPCQSPTGGAVTTSIGVNGNPGQSPTGGAVTTPIRVNGIGFQSPSGTITLCRGIATQSPGGTITIAPGIGSQSPGGTITLARRTVTSRPPACRIPCQGSSGAAVTPTIVPSTSCQSPNIAPVEPPCNDAMTTPQQDSGGAAVTINSSVSPYNDDDTDDCMNWEDINTPSVIPPEADAVSTKTQSTESQQHSMQSLGSETNEDITMPSPPPDIAGSSQSSYPPPAIPGTSQSSYPPPAIAGSSQSSYPPPAIAGSSQSSYPPPAIAGSSQSSYPPPAIAGSSRSSQLIPVIPEPSTKASKKPSKKPVSIKKGGGVLANIPEQERLNMVLGTVKKLADARVPILPKKEIGRPALTSNWQCDRCPHKSNSKPELQNHLASHDQTLHIPCTFAGCTQRFNTKQTMQRHAESHKSNKDKTWFRCSACKRRFTCVGPLLTHMKGKGVKVTCKKQQYMKCAPNGSVKYVGKDLPPVNEEDKVEEYLCTSSDSSDEE